MFTGGGVGKISGEIGYGLLFGIGVPFPSLKPKTAPGVVCPDGTLSACSNVDHIHCGRDAVFWTMWSPTKPTVVLAQMPV